MEGGYVLINLADIKLFERLLITLDLGKPILLRDGKQNYFIDKITGGNITAYEDDGITPSTYADIVLTSAIGTITIKQNGTITKASNPDTSELNAIKDYVDSVKDYVEYDADSGELNIKTDVNFQNNLIYNVKIDGGLLTSDLDANDYTISNAVIDNGKLNSNFDADNNTIQKAKLDTCSLDSDFDLAENDLKNAYYIKFSSGKTIGSDLELYYDGSDAVFNEVGVSDNTFYFTNYTDNNIVYPALAFTRNNVTTTIAFLPDGIYLNGVKITN